MNITDIRYQTRPNPSYPGSLETVNVLQVQITETVDGTQTTRWEDVRTDGDAGVNVRANLTDTAR